MLLRLMAVFSFGICTILGTTAYAQLDIRQEDQFWRKRVVNRISLIEKINAPLIRHESNYYGDNQAYPEVEGMVVSLMHGLRDGKYLAFDPDDWEKQYDYAGLMERMSEFDQALMEYESYDEEGPGDDLEGYSEDFESSDYEEFEEETDEWTEVEGDEWDTEFDTVDEEAVAEIEEDPDMAQYEEVIHVVEDWIFDKNRTKLEHVIDYFEIVWVDPSGTLPEKVLARFKWDDVRDQLDNTQWKNRYNDAEVRSVTEVFEMRIFHAYPINIGGEGIRTLQEAEFRRQELVQFEHELWNY
ncbi:hypothetical protein [Pontibacter sp. G13]|uniref:hypothetical protein n=1 Tax=Pontibacter sp. G13 TaxID=3074898 RepID=UPI00288BFBD0|nr:hypothetical protein [Pontibacter sp. G13]WNJ21185.1 hypothetical protein RJD25_12015 [Pontibacter sp. G13]